MRNVHFDKHEDSRFFLQTNTQNSRGNQQDALSKNELKMSGKIIEEHLLFFKKKSLSSTMPHTEYAKHLHHILTQQRKIVGRVYACTATSPDENSVTRAFHTSIARLINELSTAITSPPTEHSIREMNRVGDAIKMVDNMLKFWIKSITDSRMSVSRNA